MYGSARYVSSIAVNTNRGENMTEILIGWKEISQYLRVSEKTALRYHKHKGLPIEKDPAGHPVIKKISADEWRLNEKTV